MLGLEDTDNLNLSSSSHFSSGLDLLGETSVLKYAISEARDDGSLILELIQVSTFVI